MSSTVSTASPLEAPRFGHAWRDSNGTACATVHFTQSALAGVSFDDSALARELAAAILTAANAMDALPPAPEGDPQ